MSMKYTKSFKTVKTDNFHLKNFDIFISFAQNIDCGYMLESPWRGSSNGYLLSTFWIKIRNRGLWAIHEVHLSLQLSVAIAYCKMYGQMAINTNNLDEISYLTKFKYKTFI